MKKGMVPTRTLSLAWFVLIMLVTIASSTIAVLALGQDPYIRYQGLKDTIYNRASWIYERIHFDDAPIDVVFLGSSRTEAGVYPTLLEPALAKRGVKAKVVNFALASTGFDIRETIAAEVLKNRDVKLLVFDLQEVFPRDGHDAFGELAPVGEIVEAPWIVNRNLPSHLLRLPFRQIRLALVSWIPEAFGFHGAFDPSGYAGTTIDRRVGDSFDLDQLGTEEHALLLEEQSKRRYRERTPPILPDSLAWVEFGVSRTYVERITALAEKKGVKVAFLFLPFYKGPPQALEEEWLSRYGPVWNASFLKDDPRNYQDSGHAAGSPEVKAMLTDWLADHIAPLLQN